MGRRRINHPNIPEWPESDCCLLPAASCLHNYAKDEKERKGPGPRPRQIGIMKTAGAEGLLAKKLRPNANGQNVALFLHISLVALCGPQTHSILRILCILYFVFRFPNLNFE